MHSDSSSCRIPYLFIQLCLRNVSCSLNQLRLESLKLRFSERSTYTKYVRDTTRDHNCIDHTWFATFASVLATESVNML